MSYLLYFLAFLGVNAWFIREQLGGTAAAIATALLVVLPGFTVVATYLNPDIPELFFVSTAYPGTPMYDDALAAGEVEPRWWAKQAFDPTKNSAFQVRQNSRFVVERGATLNAVSVLRMLTGAIVSVWGKGSQRQIVTPSSSRVGSIAATLPGARRGL